MPFPSLVLNLHEQVGALPVTADVPSGGAYHERPEFSGSLIKSVGSKPIGLFRTSEGCSLPVL